MFDYWQWSGSSLLDNTARGLVAEFLVAAALDLHKTPRKEWEEHDLETASGIKIEVKSAGTVQAWQRDRTCKAGASGVDNARTALRDQPRREPPVQFTIAPRRRWDPERGYSHYAARWADLYVFCMLEGAEPLDTEAWRFFVLRTDVLDGRNPQQRTIRLNPLLKLAPIECRYPTLSETIERVAETPRALCAVAWNARNISQGED